MAPYEVAHNAFEQAHLSRSPTWPANSAGTLEAAKKETCTANLHPFRSRLKRLCPCSRGALRDSIPQPTGYNLFCFCGALCDVPFLAWPRLAPYD